MHKTYLLPRALGGSVLAGLLLLATACGSATSDPTAASGGADQGSDTSVTEPRRDADGHLVFTATDYDFTVTRMCFCADGGVPLRVSVRDGKVAKVVYMAGKQKGKPAPRVSGVTLGHIIKLVHDKDADHLDVVWPKDQAWPTSVSHQTDRLMMDSGVAYEISDVEPVSAS